MGQNTLLPFLRAISPLAQRVSHCGGCGNRGDGTVLAECSSCLIFWFLVFWFVSARVEFLKRTPYARLTDGTIRANSRLTLCCPRAPSRELSCRDFLLILLLKLLPCIILPLIILFNITTVLRILSIQVVLLPELLLLLLILL